MNKRTVYILLGIALCILVICALVARCGSPEPNEGGSVTTTPSPGKETISASDVSEIIDVYNSKAAEYNLAVHSYNDSVQQLVEANSAIEETIKNAQAQLVTTQIPFDPNTQIALENAIASAESAILPAPELTSEVELISIAENADADELEEIYEKTRLELEVLTETDWPVPISIPDYFPCSMAIETAVIEYLNSVRIMEQITAPGDDFVIERLKGIDTILSLAAVTSKNDPNKLLGKEGGYIGCIYFSDSRVDKTLLNLDPDEYDVISMGTVGGGAIEIYRTVEEANTRNEYLSQYDGTTLDPGSHIVVGTMIIRTSSKLSETDQLALEAEIIDALTWIDNAVE